MQNQQADKFTFADTQSNDIYITFLPQMLRGDRKVPQLDYQGSLGKFSFWGNEIKQQPSNLGLLISITLKINKETESLDFALVLPSINLQSQKRQYFETVAIATTRNRKIIANHTGTEFTYKVFTLKGCAEKLAPVPSANWQNFYLSPSPEELYNLVDFQRF